MIDAVIGIEPALVLSLQLLPRIGLGDALDLPTVGTVEPPYSPRLHWFAFYLHGLSQDRITDAIIPPYALLVRYTRHWSRAAGRHSGFGP